MKEYDIIIIGSGCGLLVAQAAVRQGYKTALIEKGHLGGTCLNVGCIPSKMLIQPADVIYGIEQAHKLGINAEVSHVDFPAIMERTRVTVTGYRNGIHDQLHKSNNLDLYESQAKFLDNYTIEVEGQKIHSKKIFIAAGARPFIPDGFSQSKGYLTNDILLELSKLPEKLLIIGGGYIACEYAHFFASMGSHVTLIEMSNRLLGLEEAEISSLVEKTLKRKVSVYTNTRVKSIAKTEKEWEASTENIPTGKPGKFSGTHVLYAMGRTPNTDLLNLGATTIDLDENGFIKVNQYLETSVDGIYAIGDINGQHMFRHTANYEAEIAWHNANSHSDGKHKRAAVDYSAMPRAVFTRPQIASVGLTEAEARNGYHVKTARVNYSDVAKGKAMQEKEGFAKAVIDADTGNILGFHIAGPEATILIQEVINAMATDKTTASIDKGIHIHPALSELIPNTFSAIE